MYPNGGQDRITIRQIHGNRDQKFLYLNFLTKLFLSSTSKVVFIYGYYTRKHFVDTFSLHKKMDYTSTDPARIELKGKVLFFLPHPESILRYATKTVLTSLLRFFGEMRDIFKQQLVDEDDLDMDNEDDEDDGSDTDNEQDGLDPTEEEQEELKIDTARIEKRIREFSHQEFSLADNEQEVIKITRAQQLQFLSFKLDGTRIRWTTVKAIGADVLDDLARKHANDNDNGVKYNAALEALRADLRKKSNDRAQKKTGAAKAQRYRDRLTEEQKLRITARDSKTKKKKAFRDGIQRLMDKYEENGMTKKLAVWYARRAPRYSISGVQAALAYGSTDVDNGYKFLKKRGCLRRIVKWLLEEMRKEKLTGRKAVVYQQTQKSKKQGFSVRDSSKRG